MARKKKSNENGAMAMSAPSEPKSINIRIEKAENGYTVNCSGSGKNGEYHSKSYVAPNQMGAIRLATQGMGSIGTKSKGKKKKSNAKVALSKRG